jgi:dihydropteroate synthase
VLQIGSLKLNVPAVMGVLNVTPDSFSDGGRFASVDAALRRAETMAAEGAAIIDVGGESTRPGAGDVSEDEELERVMPVIEGMRRNLDVPVSIDTGKPGVMRAAVAAGASMINDVYALRLPGALAAAAELGRPVCLMHMQGEPRTMQNEPHYADVVAEVTQFLGRRVAECVQAGIDRARIVVDPGFGFGKSPAHNVELLGNLRAIVAIGCPVLIGLSRKATLGVLTGRDVESRLPASLAAAVLGVMQGAQIVRAHDVAATVDALVVTRAVLEKGRGG